MILLVGVLPGVLAEEDFYSYNYEYVEISLASWGEGDYTANYANLSTVPKNYDDWEEFGNGIYVGAYEEENLFQFDFVPPTWNSDLSPIENGSDIPFVLRNYEPAYWLLAYENVYFCVENVIEFSSNEIISGGSYLWVRVPVPVSSIANGVRSGSVPTAAPFIQVVNLDTEKVFFLPIDDPRWGDAGLYGYNSTIVNDRLYVELRCPILPETEYLFQFFCPLQGTPPDYTSDDDLRETGVLKPSCYFTPEDTFQSGTYTVAYGGVLGFNTDTMQFFVYDEYGSYGGFEYNISLDSGWSFLFVEGMGHNLFGVEVDITTGDILEFRPTITPQENNSHVSLYLPFICEDEVEYNITMIGPSGSSWYLSNGTPANITTYWSNNEDCDGDSYLDYPDLVARDFFVVSSKTLISNYTYLKSSEWRFLIEFGGDYQITFLSQNDDTIMYIGDDINPYLTNCWLIHTDDSTEYKLFNSLVWHYSFLSDGLFTERSFNATGESVFTYPHFYRYALAHVFGSRTVWVEVNETTYNMAVEGLILWDGLPEVDRIRRSLIDQMYDGFQGAWGVLDQLGGQIRDGFYWLVDELQRIGQWIYSGMMEFIEIVKLVVEAIVNVLSFVVEFGIIGISLLVFFGAIILYNKFLIIVRDALYKLLTGINKTYLMVGGGD